MIDGFFQGRTRLYVGQALEMPPSQADIDKMTEWKGVRPSHVWVDEMQGDIVRDERAEEARRIAREREEFDRHTKTQQILASMNRADRRRWLRENRPR